ncbi:MAG: ferritin family protein [Planctomycetota bacterium]|jgi:rubrerythrin
MGVVTIAEVLRHVEEFEDMLAEFYAKLARSETEREGVRLLADYMSRHRRRTHRALFELPVESVEHIRRICHTRLRYEPQQLNRHCFDGVELPPDGTADEMLDIAIEFDECLVRFYQQVVRQPVDREIKTLFDSLIRWEQNDEIELKKIKAMHYF